MTLYQFIFKLFMWKEIISSSNALLTLVNIEQYYFYVIPVTIIKKCQDYAIKIHAQGLLN